MFYFLCVASKVVMSLFSNKSKSANNGGLSEGFDGLFFEISMGKDCIFKFLMKL